MWSRSTPAVNKVRMTTHNSNCQRFHLNQTSSSYSFQNNTTQDNKLQAEFSSDPVDGLGAGTVSLTFACGYTKQSWGTLNTHFLNDSCIARSRYSFEALWFSSCFCQYLHAWLRHAVSTGKFWQSATSPSTVCVTKRLNELGNSQGGVKEGDDGCEHSQGRVKDGDDGCEHQMTT